ncbi:metal ABC transporter ATP-binding protein [Planosporangium mesophilum]|uniref:metal ABC transporter ATP-binding protein n=1 Tax=Planosporangium mesophilum TaxID=689768 RepID=UPI00143BB58A|nr:metal ABC transporter ATP-binding protein [Planosporangium mesophilum]NJC85533.1 metal ABC transporter ATP-binding protein [Planosporangium mesophilum]
MTGNEPVVAAEGIVVGYGGRPVLHGVTLRVTAGEVVAVLGANGSGKSTLIKSVLGLLSPRGGEVRLFGTPQRRFRDWYRIGYVPQRLDAGGGVPATVREVVASGRLARRGFLRGLLGGGAADREAVSAALVDVGLTQRANDPVSTLSGGQQQRVLIARALAGRPDLLVLDEPTAGVDAASQEAFASALRRFVSRGGTVLLVAHELGPLAPLVSRAVVVHHGNIVHDGQVPEPVGHHAGPHHDHVHPHAPYDRPGIWGAP